MKFDELDKQMRVFETARDYCVLPGIFIVARIDGRNFTQLTKKVHNFEAPFDEKFRDYMVETTSHLMNCGFNIIYGFTESDEISLLFHPNEITFSRKTRKLISVLAGEASAKFSLLSKAHAAFDARICELPQKNIVTDYFRWRNEDAHRNALNAHCYWALRKDGWNENRATEKLSGLSTSEKNELLFQYGINFNDLPNWQKRGIGIYWDTKEKIGFNPISKTQSSTERKYLKVDMDLPMKDDYNSFIDSLLRKSG